MIVSQSIQSLSADSCQADQSKLNKKRSFYLLFFSPTVLSVSDYDKLTGEQETSFLFCLRICFGSINLDQLEAALSSIRTHVTLLKGHCSWQYLASFSGKININ